MSHSVAAPVLPPLQQAMPPLSGVLLAFTLLIFRWETLRRTRKDLSRLDEHMLRDIGMDPALAQSETAKPFWRA